MIFRSLPFSGGEHFHYIKKALPAAFPIATESAHPIQFSNSSFRIAY